MGKRFAILMKRRTRIAIAGVTATLLLAIPAAAFGAKDFYPGNPHDGPASMRVERENGKNKRVKALSFSQFRVNCPKSGPTKVQTYLDEAITGKFFRSEIAIDAAVQHGKWHFNDLVLDAVGRNSIERIDASINFQGKFRKHNKNKADGTLEVTLEGVDFGSGPEDCSGVHVFHVSLTSFGRTWAPDASQRP